MKNNGESNIDKQIRILLTIQHINNILDEIKTIPGKLKRITDKTLDFIDREIRDIDNKQQEFKCKLNNMIDKTYYDEDGNFYSKKADREVQAEEYYNEQLDIIADYESAMRKMLINFFFESYENLSKMIDDKLKENTITIIPIKRIYESTKNDITKVELINNCIKHNDCKTNKTLEQKFPNDFKNNQKIELNKQLVYELLEITQKSINKIIDNIIIIKRYINC